MGISNLTAQKEKQLAAARTRAESYVNAAREILVPLIKETANHLGIELRLEEAEIKYPTFELDGEISSPYGTINITKSASFLFWRNRRKIVGQFAILQNTEGGQNIWLSHPPFTPATAWYLCGKKPATLKGVNDAHAKALASGRLEFLRGQLVL